jgi:C4-dicarboxylate-specific signal transduction histidine kinase
VVRDFADLPPVLIDKQRVLQIVINLVKNAKEALLEQRQAERTVTLRSRQQDGRLLIEVQDTGSGIKPQNLTRIFSHGFTTKKSGHGFGLHSCANAATEMNGSLSARSDGELSGATFTLNLPYTPVAAPAAL